MGNYSCMGEILYKGWIPTVGCRLSFRIIGNSQYPTPAITSNVADSKCRHIITFQRRPTLLDSALPIFKHFFARTLLHLNSDFRFICVAHNGNDCEDLSGPLRGSLYIVYDKHTWKEHVYNAVKSAQSQLDQFDQTQPLSDYFRSQVEPRLEPLLSHCLYEASFELERNGIVTIYPSEASPTGAAKSDFEDYRNQFLTNRELQDKVCSQLFYFLKDICHVHQHHHPTTDTIVRLHPREPDQSDIGWINQTLRDLYTKILEFKRIKDDEIFASAIGVLAYLNSFTEVARANLPQEDHARLAVRNNENLKTSIEASQMEYRADLDRRARFFDIFRTTLFGLVGILIALAGLGSLMGDQITITTTSEANYVEKLANEIVNNPTRALLFTMIAVIAILVYEDVIAWKRWRWLRDLLRLGQSLKRRGSALMFLSLAALSAVTAYLAFRAAPTISEWINAAWIFISQ